MLLQFLIPEQDKLVEIFASVQPDFDQNYILKRKIGRLLRIYFCCHNMLEMFSKPIDAFLCLEIKGFFLFYNQESHGFLLRLLRGGLHRSNLLLALLFHKAVISFTTISPSRGVD